jgi:hypothetical protein
MSMVVVDPRVQRSRIEPPDDRIITNADGRFVPFSLQRR